MEGGSRKIDEIYLLLTTGLPPFEQIFIDKQATVCYILGEYVVSNFRLAFECAQIAAKQRQAGVQFLIGCMYNEGLDMAQDSEKTFEWFMKLAIQGNAEAQNHVGYMYDNGFGVKLDYEEAFKWFVMAAKQGVAIA